MALSVMANILLFVAVLLLTVSEGKSSYSVQQQILAVAALIHLYL